MLLKENITSLYVSQQNGKSGNSGFAPDTALDSIASALHIIRELRQNGYRQPISIKIVDTEYIANAPVIIDESICDVTIEPYTETKISGGMRIENFKTDTFNAIPCLSAQIDDVKAGKLWFTDLYVNGKAAAFTRYPATDFLYAKAVENNSTKLNAHSKWFIAETEDLAVIKNFRNFSDCFISYNHYWIDEHTPIESYDIETGKIVFSYASRFSIEPIHEAAKLRYVLENVAEAFKNPGEWYLDRPTGKVYYIPREGENADNIVAYAPITPKLFILEGTKDKKISGITLRNFDLNCTKGDYRSQYIDIDREKDIYAFDENFEGYASDIQSVCWGHGSIEMNYAHSCTIHNCRLVNMGVHAINIGRGCDNIYITDNEIREIGAGGVKIDGGELEEPEYTYTHGVHVRNNLITHCGNRYFAACGILIKQAYECEISHNEVSRLYYTGISCGWTWCYKPSVNRDNIIEKNHIHHLGQGKLSDMGGIYILSEQPGTIIRGNLIHDVESKHYGGWGLYTDEGSSYITLENNICYNLTNNGYHQHYGRHNTVRNNIFAFSGKSPAAITRGEEHTGLLFENNIFVSDNAPIFSIGFTKDREGNNHYELLGKHFVSARNLFYDKSGNIPAFLYLGNGENNTTYTMTQARNEIEYDTDSLVADPMFVDLNNFNFSLKPDSPAFKLGFKPIDISDVGVIKK